MNKQQAIYYRLRNYVGRRCKACMNRDKWTLSGLCVECHPDEEIQPPAVVSPARRASNLEAKHRSMQKYGLLPVPTRPRPELCECCSKPNPDGSRLSLEHDHQTGAFRGWTCRKCNTGISMLGDCLEGVEMAVTYLHKAKFAVPVGNV